MESSKLLAIDPSLRATGWVLFEVAREEPLAAGVVAAPGTDRPLAERLNILQRTVEDLFSRYVLSVNDILVCEGPAPLVLNPQSAIKVEHVRGIFETLARVRGMTVPGRLNPRTVQVELLGMRGKQIARKEVKLWARETAVRLYGSKLEEAYACGKSSAVNTRSTKLPQDIIDAALIGALSLTRIKRSLSSEISLEELFAEGQKQGRRSGNWSEADLLKL